MAVLKSPSVLLKRANAPLAVFSFPVVLFKSAPAPVAVLLSATLNTSVNGCVELALYVARKRIPAKGGIVSAGREA